MKKLLTILILLCAWMSAYATDYYVATAANGGSNSNTGLTGSPWLTLTYACAHVPAGAHTIHVGTGTFNETTQSVLAVGVDIDGNGIANTIINSTYSGVLLLLSSSVVSTQGDNTISDIWFDGNMTGDRAIDVMARDNVEIYNCKFTEFFTTAVQFFGTVGGASGAPSIWATDCEFHDNIVTNCAKYVVGDQGYGNLRVGGTIGMLIYNNVITQTARTSNLHGYCLKFCGGGWNKGLKVYDNDLIMPEVNSNWDFAFEMFHSLGGMEIYNNRIRGTLDFSSSPSGHQVTMIAGDYTFAVKIHDNYFYNSQHLNWSNYGVDLEHHFSGGIYIYRNKFENLRYAFANSVINDADGASIQHDVYIMYNIVVTPGINTTDPSAAFFIGHSTAAYYDNWNVYNNTVYGNNESTYGLRVNFNAVTTATNIAIRNNIIRGFSQAIYIYNSKIDNLDITDNILYENGTNTVTQSGNTLTNYTNADNLYVTPQWVSMSDWHLQSTSPAINAGYDLNATYYDMLDYDSVAVSATTPEIGAYEYAAPNPAVAPTVITGAVTKISTTTATGNGVVTSDGDATITDRGICWGESLNPVMAGNHVHAAGTTGAFTGSITGVVSGTLYYVRAWAINSQGTSYGANVTFTPSSWRVVLLR